MNGTLGCRFFASDTIELSKLYLCPSVYGKGLGKQLMRHFEESIELTSAFIPT
ncbi:GNAT family N-acetyltransferase [Shewanella halifaxensis]|uniref:GNAT family N-acetyltransferase n=1 Tax=Shewanella halifaxensis TaxID=271098 RepID=UPI00352B420E